MCRTLSRPLWATKLSETQTCKGFGLRVLLLPAVSATEVPVTSFSSAGSSWTSDLHPDSPSAKTQASQTLPAETSLRQHQDNHRAAARDVRWLFSGKRTGTKGDRPAAGCYTGDKAKVKVCCGRAPPGSWPVILPRQALPGVPRIRPQTVVVVCYFAYFLGYKTFYFMGVSDPRWESSPVRSRMNLASEHRSVLSQQRSSGTESNFRWTSANDWESVQGLSPAVPTTEVNPVTGKGQEKHGQNSWWSP